MPVMAPNDIRIPHAPSWVWGIPASRSPEATAPGRGVTGSTRWHSPLRLMSGPRTGIPMRRASPTSSRAGYMPGSCSQTPAMKASGWWVFNHADW